MCRVLEVSGTAKRESKERPRELWEQGDKGLLKDLLVGWKAAAGAGPWAIQPQGWPCTSAFPGQVAYGGEGGAGPEGTSFPGLEGQAGLGTGTWAGGACVPVVGEVPSSAW